MNMRFYIYSCTLICMKRSEAIDQLREMDAKYSCYVYCKNELGTYSVINPEMLPFVRSYFHNLNDWLLQRWEERTRTKRT